jgi:hypothetical protein
VEGDVFLNDQPVEYSSTRFPDVKENAVVRTVDGRAEVLLTPGVTLRLGENSSLKMITNRLIDTRVELLTGSAVIEADAIAKDTSVTLVDKNASVAIPKSGIYRFNAEPAEVKVLKGSASVEVGGTSKEVGGGHLLALNSDNAAIEKFDADDTDSLDRWSHRRASYQALANASAANSLLSSSYMPLGWGMNGCNSAWGFNAYFGMMTYLPCNGMLWSPYGYAFWSPFALGNRYWINPPVIYGGGAGRTTVASSQSGSASLARPVASRGSAAIGGFRGLGGSHGAHGATSAYAGANGGFSSTAIGRSSGGFSGGGFSGGAAASGGGHAGGFGGGGASAGAGSGGGAGHGGGGGGHH